jgi:hypothetical protein
MAAVSLTNLIARSRQRADMPVAGFIADDANGIYAFINEGVQKLQELLVKAYGGEFLETSTTFSTVAGTTDYNLPTDMLAFYGIDMAMGGAEFALLPYSRGERNLFKNQSVIGSWRSRPRYKLSGKATGVVRLLPAPDGVYTCRIWYAPSATLLTAGTDTVNFPNGWERYVVVYAAIQMLMKEESDTRELRIELDKMEDELREIAERRNADQPAHATDVESVEIDDPARYF